MRRHCEKISSWRFWLTYAFIAGVTIFIYYPSFFHLARSDQLIYLGNTRSFHGWTDLVAGTYAYDRVPHRFEGFDAVLFRPLFFTLLGTEKFFFGYRFLAWQVTGVILHLLVVGCLLRLLWAMRPGWPAAVTALFFACLFVGMEMVIWHHVNGYLAFLICVLTCLYHLYRITITGCVSFRQLGWLTVLSGLAVFIYELGTVYACVFFIYLWLIQGKKRQDGPPRRWYGLILLSVAFYCAWSGWDLAVRHLGVGQGRTVLEAFNLPSALSRAFWALAWMLYGGLMPAQLQTKLWQRTVFQADYFRDWRQWGTGGIFSRWDLILVAATLLGVFLLRVFNKTGGLRRRQWAFLTLLAVLLGIHGGGLVVARLDFYDLETFLSYNAYYAYYIWLYFVIIFYLWIISPLDSRNFKWRILAVGVTLLWMGHIGVNAREVYQLNQRRARRAAGRRFLLANIERRRQEARKKGEYFSFFMDPRLDMNLPWVKQARGGQKGSYTFFQVLYGEEFDPVNPRFLYKWSPQGPKIGQRY